MAERNTGYKYEITPDFEHRLFDFRQLKDYSDLVFLFVKRDFIASYKQTALGPLWVVLRPLIMNVAYVLVFGSLAKFAKADVAGQSQVPGFLFYFSGSICWSYFAGTVSAVSNGFSANSRIAGKVWFPRMVIPVSCALSKFISFAIQFAMLAVSFAVYAVRGTYLFRFSFRLLFIPLLLFLLMILGMGTGMIAASLSVYYRDLKQVMPFIMQVWHYGTPVAYGLTFIPQRYVNLYLLNPVSCIVTSFRFCLFNQGFFSFPVFLRSLLIIFAVFIFGRILFGRVERNFIDYV